MNSKFLIFENGHTLTNYLLKRWVELATEAIARHGRFCVAVSAGKTPREFYCKLSGVHIPQMWEKTHLFLVDEKFVEADHAESHYRMVKEQLLDYVPAHLHGFDTALTDVSAGAQKYENDLKRFFQLKEGELPCFDMIYLGLDQKGRSASLSESNINQKDRLVTIQEDDQNDMRMSLSLPVINNAQTIFTAVCGSHKSDVVERIVAQDETLAALQIRPSKGQHVYLLDRHAASELSYKYSSAHEGDAVILEK